MYSSLTVSSCIDIQAGCPVHYCVHDGEDVEFSFGNPGEGVELMFSAEAFRQFVRLGNASLQERDAARLAVAEVERVAPDEAAERRDRAERST